jgi:hypothetical protein
MRVRTLSAVVALSLGVTVLPADTRADGQAWTPSPAWQKQKKMEKQEERARYLDRPSGTRDQPQRALPSEDELTRLARERRASGAARLQRENRLLQEQRALPRAKD